MCYYVQRVSHHTEHQLAPIREASVLLQEYRCLFRCAIMHVALKIHWNPREIVL